MQVGSTETQEGKQGQGKSDPSSEGRRQGQGTTRGASFGASQCLSFLVGACGPKALCTCGEHAAARCPAGLCVSEVICQPFEDELRAARLLAESKEFSARVLCGMKLFVASVK